MRAGVYRAWLAASALVLVAPALVLAGGCRALTGGAEQDEVEKAREEERTDGEPPAPASEESIPPEAMDSAKELERLEPLIDVGDEGFHESRPGELADVAAEGVVILAFAALIAGLVHLYRHRLPLLSFLLSVAAVAIAAFAVFSSST